MAENTEKKSFGSRIAKFWRDFRSEMKKIVWMSGSDLRKNSILVLVAVVVISAVIGLIDFGLSQAIGALGKIV